MVLTKNINKPVPISIITQSIKCVCKIEIKEDGKLISGGTGFFMKLINSAKYLITAGYLINDEVINNNQIEVEIWNEKKTILKCNERFIKKFEFPSPGTAIIEIKESDNIYNDICFFDYDMKYLDSKGYSIYNNADVFSIQYPMGKEAGCSVGKIKKINKIDNYRYEFAHDILTKKGSPGSPIILYNNRVIGIHISGNNGCFIGDTIKEIDKLNPITPNINNKDKNKIFSNKDFKINNNMNKKINTNIINKKNNNINTNNYIQRQNSISNNNINNPIQLDIDIVKNEKNNINRKENAKEIITIYINSSDQLLNCKIRCKCTDRFNKIVNIILEKEPEFIEKVDYFICNGNKVNEYKSLKDNGIKDGNVVLLNVID